MRTASMVLGLVGGALAIIFSLLFILGGVFVSGISSAMPSFGEISVDNGHVTIDDDINVTWDGDDMSLEDWGVTIEDGEISINDDQVSVDAIIKDSALDDDVVFNEDNGSSIKIDTEEIMTATMNTVSVVIIILGIVSIVGAGLAIAGGIIVRKKNVMGGVFMLVGGVMSVVTVYGILSMIILILGGIFAFIPDKSAQPAGPQPVPPQIEGPAQ